MVGFHHEYITFKLNSVSIVDSFLIEFVDSSNVSNFQLNSLITITSGFGMLDSLHKLNDFSVQKHKHILG